MRWSMQWTQVAMAVCLTGVVACSDDGSKGGAQSQPDGAVVNPGTDGGSNSLDGGLDGSLVVRDATVAADGAITEPANDSGNGDACGNCNDDVDCTIDSCKNGKCEHRVDNDFCAAGSSCDFDTGCQKGKTCSNSADCADMDGCTTNERCNTMLAQCEHDVLDRDGDGYPPAACGGTDCDDTRGTVNPSATETCNSRDDDCDGAVDDNLTPVAGYACTNGQVECATGYENCGGQVLICVDLKTNHDSCGQCGNLCDSGETCENGACKCTPGGSVMQCGTGVNASCEDISKSQFDCGGCSMVCQPLAMGGQVQTCIASTCTACGGEGQPCCADANGLGPLQLSGCGPGLTCNGIKGSTASKCECGAGSAKCGNGCVDITSNDANCGACGLACGQGEACVTTGGVTACEQCGGLGEACCNGVQRCLGANTCGPDDTCVVANAGGPGGPGGPGGM